jgi:tetratricopeptide (TPR) repeat protein
LLHYFCSLTASEVLQVFEPNSPGPFADRNLLFGILSLQLDFIDRDTLVAALNAWVLDKTKPIGQTLLEGGKLSAERLNPFYLFWSRTFMIESTALFFGISCVAAIAALIRRPSYSLALAAILLAVLAALTKITTSVSFIAGALVLLAADLLFSGSNRARRMRTLAFGTALVLLVVAAALPWTHYTDVLKARSPLGQSLTSQVLWSWNVGTLAQRMDWSNWWSIVVLPLIQSQFHYLLLIGIAVLSLFVKARRNIVTCLILYLVAPSIFLPLHNHQYYAYANLIFLIVALGLVLVSGMNTEDWRRPVSLGLFALTLAVNIYNHQTLYLPLQGTNDLTVSFIGSIARQLTEPDEIILIYGQDWSAAISFHAERRALMLPAYANDDMAERALKTVEHHRVGAMVVFDGGPGWFPPKGGLAEQRKRFHLSEVAAYSSNGISVYPHVRLEETYRRYLVAKNEMPQGHWEEAYNLLTRCYSENPKDAFFLIDRSRCSLSLRKERAALEDCNRAIELEPSVVYPRIHQAQCTLAAARRLSEEGVPTTYWLDQALLNMGAAIQSAPRVVEFYTLRARIYEAMGRSEEARRDRTEAALLRQPRLRYLNHGAGYVENKQRKPGD